MASNPEFDVITFDCYGTLIDWERGIHAAFKSMLKASGLERIDQSKVFHLYEREERKIERETPFRPYKEVLSMSAQAVLERMGLNVDSKLVGALAQELPLWSPFADINPALEKIARKSKLGILSNIDNDLIAETLKHFTVPFDIVITAEQIRSYKPRPKHFEEARKAMGRNRKWLHVAASLYHDIEPVSRLGIDSVWVNRQNLVPSGGMSRAPLKEVKNLIGLVDWLKLE